VDNLLSTLVGVAIGGAAPWPAKGLWRVLRGHVAISAATKAAEEAREQSEIERLVARCTDLEDLVDLLRKALDKHLIRESAIASACELLIALVKLVDKPSAAMLHIRDRAQRILIDAQAHISSINRGDK
jgi:hypothetical protein